MRTYISSFKLAFLRFWFLRHLHCGHLVGFFFSLLVISVIIETPCHILQLGVQQIPRFSKPITRDPCHMPQFVLPSLCRYSEHINIAYTVYIYTKKIYYMYSVLCEQKLTNEWDRDEFGA